MNYIVEFTDGEILQIKAKLYYFDKKNNLIIFDSRKYRHTIEVKLISTIKLEEGTVIYGKNNS